MDIPAKSDYAVRAMLALAELTLEDGALRSAARNGSDELSGREVEVLRGLAGPGSLREVADELYISRNTIKTHTRALYAKLGVGTREEAVRRGRELGLVGGGLARSTKGGAT